MLAGNGHFATVDTRSTASRPIGPGEGKILRLYRTAGDASKTALSFRKKGRCVGVAEQDQKNPRLWWILTENWRPSSYALAFPETVPNEDWTEVRVAGKSR